MLASTCSAVPSPNGSASGISTDIRTDVSTDAAAADAAAGEHGNDQTAPHGSDVAGFGNDDSATPVAPVQAASPARAQQATGPDPVRAMGSSDPSATQVSSPGRYNESSLQIELAVLSEVNGISTAEFVSSVLGILNDDRGWPAAGFTFVSNSESDFRIVLAEGDRVDEICWPLRTLGRLSCRNGSTIALNADRWREATDDWDSALGDYRSYLVNHEIGHLLGFGHPTQPCVSPTARLDSNALDSNDTNTITRALVMAQQTKGLAGCTGNGWPLATEIEAALTRPIIIGG